MTNVTLLCPTCDFSHSYAESYARRTELTCPECGGGLMERPQSAESELRDIESRLQADALADAELYTTLKLSADTGYSVIGGGTSSTATGSDADFDPDTFRIIADGEGLYTTTPVVDDERPLHGYHHWANDDGLYTTSLHITSDISFVSSHKPNPWWRFWQRVLLGWRWE